MIEGRVPDQSDAGVAMVTDHQPIDETAPATGTYTYPVPSAARALYNTITLVTSAASKNKEF